MRFKRRLKFEHGQKDIIIAPLISVMFILLLFFMLSGALPQPSTVVDMPESITGNDFKKKLIEITLSSENIIYAGNRPFSQDGLKFFLKDIASYDRAVLIKTDSKASFGMLADVIEMCRKQGVRQIRIVSTED